jgi:TRAP-type C4-dicarboxylate transport system substrate-binding protein
MMKKKRIQILSLISFVILCLVFSATMAAAGPIVLKAVSHLDPNNAHCRTNKPFIDMVNKRANGELVIKFLGGPEVIPSFDQAEALKKGTIDIIPTYPMSWFKPMMGAAADISGMSEIPAWEERKTGAFEIYDELFQKYANAKYLGRFHGGWGFNFYTNKKIQKIDDFKGMNVRVMSLYLPFTKKLGASPVTVPPPEIYQALERHIIDGFMFPTFGITGYAWHEVTKYKIEPEVFQAEPVCVVNLDTWNKIPKHLQELMKEVAEIVEYWGVADSMWVKEQDEDILKSAGVEIIKLQEKDAKAFRDLAYKTTWELLEKESPEYCSKLRKRITKDALAAK